MIGGEKFTDEIFEAENPKRAKVLAKLGFCSPPASHMCNIKILSCKEVKQTF